jgi:hypothetical protein
MVNNKQQMKLPPKEKAQELVGEFFDTFINDEDEHYVEMAWRLSKQSALFAVNKILIAIQDLPIDEVNWDYYQQVKQEIEKL